tara:strand:- start:776 stop:1546 length:771 start_codon:yes stop_codon:yes gene_type:complete
MLQDITNRLNRYLGGGQGGTVLGNGYTDKINYVDPLIANPAYDIAKGGEQYEAAPEGLVWDANRGHYVKQGAHTGLLGGALGILDWANQNYSDWDRAGIGKDKYGNLPEAGTLGGQRVQIMPKMNNPHYDAAKARALQVQQQSGAVPEINNFGTFANQFAQDAYSGWRDNRLKVSEAERNLLYNKIANEYAFQLDKAGMREAMNTPYWQARTSLTAQQAMAVPRLAKAALIEAIAKRQGSANEFGQLGTKRTYFTG